MRNILDQDGVDDGFLEYYWSNPLRNDDLVVDDSGNPIRGLSPGTSVKDGYFLETNLGGFSPFNFVLGSGIYPDKEYYEPEGGMCQDIPDDLSEFARGYLNRNSQKNQSSRNHPSRMMMGDVQLLLRTGAISKPRGLASFL